MEKTITWMLNISTLKKKKNVVWSLPLDQLSKPDRHESVK